MIVTHIYCKPAGKPRHRNYAELWGHCFTEILRPGAGRRRNSLDQPRATILDGSLSDRRRWSLAKLGCRPQHQRRPRRRRRQSPSTDLLHGRTAGAGGCWSPRRRGGRPPWLAASLVPLIRPGIQPAIPASVRLSSGRSAIVGPGQIPDAEPRGSESSLRPNVPFCFIFAQMSQYTLRGMKCSSSTARRHFRAQ